MYTKVRKISHTRHCYKEKYLSLQIRRLIMNIRERFRSIIEQKDLCKKEDLVLVALSGGADSTALLCLFAECGFHIEALHCNFHLRGKESDRDEEFCKLLCQKYNIPCHIQHFDTKSYAISNQISIEMAARDLRYEWFEQKRKEINAECIAVAHHLDDQAETIILNIARGTGIRGLAGMRARNGHIVRPLLDFSRKELLEYLSSISQNFVTDSTNLEKDALRNIVRLDMVPLLKEINAGAINNIANTASRMQESIRYYKEGVEAAFCKCGITMNQMIISKFINNGGDTTLLYEWLSPSGFSSSQIKDIHDNLTGRVGAIFETNSHRLLRDRDTLILSEKLASMRPYEITERFVHVGCGENAVKVISQIGYSNNRAFLDADKLSEKWHTRLVKPGDKMKPFGMNGASKLVSDIMTDAKQNRFERATQQVVTIGNDIIWLVGIRASELYKVTPQTRRILILEQKKQ